MFQKGYKISFRLYLNLFNAKFSRIDVEKRVYKEVILSLHFSIASFNMKEINRKRGRSGQHNQKSYGTI